MARARGRALGASPRAPRFISLRSDLLGDGRSRGRARGPHEVAGVAGEDLRHEGKKAPAHSPPQRLFATACGDLKEDSEMIHDNRQSWLNGCRK